MARLGLRVDGALERRREARRAQHAQAVLGEALARRRPRRGAPRASRSCCPSNGSIRCPSSGSMAMALKVKSRRARSAVMSSTNSTLSGPPPVAVRALAAQRRDLVVHARACTTVTVPCWIPVGITLRKNATTSSGPRVGARRPSPSRRRRGADRARSRRRSSRACPSRARRRQMPRTSSGTRSIRWRTSVDMARRSSTRAETARERALFHVPGVDDLAAGALLAGPPSPEPARACLAPRRA